MAVVGSSDDECGSQSAVWKMDSTGKLTVRVFKDAVFTITCPNMDEGTVFTITCLTMDEDRFGTGVERKLYGH